MFVLPTDIIVANDISRNSYNILRVRKTLAGAHEVLTSSALLRARVLMSKVRGEYTNLRSKSDRTELDHSSILGSVVGVTQEVNAMTLALWQSTSYTRVVVGQSSLLGQTTVRRKHTAGSARTPAVPAYSSSCGSRDISDPLSPRRRL